MAEVIYIDGAKGGSGATTCAVRLALALSGLGERSLVIDGDSECAGGLEACGLRGMNVYTLADAESGECRVKQAVLQHPASPNMYVLPTLGLKDKNFADAAVSECAKLFDVIICDGAGIGACKRAIVVSDPYPSSLAHAQTRGAKLKDGGFANVELIVNKVNGGLVFDGAVLTPQEFASVVRLPLLGVIPEDLTLPLGKIRKSTERAFGMTAAAVLGRSKKTYGTVKPYVGVTGYFKRKLRAHV
ncbi:MAG: AAA family ATPase [Clostridia bacterium]|nr:AAA family ATPase [Clostridia bacterium]